jgi:hypothetical protein
VETIQGSRKADMKLPFVIAEAISAPITLKTCFEKRFEFREFDFEVVDEDSNLPSSQLNLGRITNFPWEFSDEGNQIEPTCAWFDVFYRETIQF